MKIFKILTPFFVLLVIVGVYFYRVPIQDYFFELRRGSLPEEIPADQVLTQLALLEAEPLTEIDNRRAGQPRDQVEDQGPVISKDQKTEESRPDATPEQDNQKDGDADAEKPEELPEEINLAVPFTPQAPFAIWDEIHEDACEEAALLMVHRFWAGKPFVSAQDAEDEILQIVEFENDYFGFWKDTNAEQTAAILLEYYGYPRVDVYYDITIEDIKREVGRGFPVILPAYGRSLGNPYFRQPGPVYHMLVVKGYTKDNKFITNDPGTKRGADYVYDEEALLNAVHDWNNGDVENGRRAMIVVRPN